jgi:hypothetical protein
MKKPLLTRRSLIKGVGAAALASPLIPLLNVSGAEPVIPKRVLLFFTPHGTIYDQWRPAGSNNQFTLGSILQPLAPLQNKLVVLDKMRMNANFHANVGGVPHPVGMATLWTGSRVNDIETATVPGNVPTGVWATSPSVDQIIAQRLPLETKYRSLELGLQTGISQCAFRTIYTAAKSAVNPQIDPASIYQSLFANLNVGNTAQVQVKFDKQSFFDLHKAELDTLVRDTSIYDRPKLQAHLTAVRDLERTLAETMSACATPGKPAAVDFNQVPNRPELVDQQTTLIAAALACDLTRVLSFQYSNGHDNVPYPWLNYAGAHHDNLTHDESDVGVRAKRVEICTWYSKMFAQLLGKLNAIPEGDGTLLDHTMVVWGTEVAKGDHTFTDVPFIVAGGGAYGVRTGQFLDTQGAFHQRLLVSIARYMGLADVQTIGDLDTGSGRVPGLLVD